MTKPRSKTLKAIIILAALLMLPLLPQIIGETTYLTSYVANLAFEGNWHEVVPGKFYRSAELDAQTLSERIQKYGIKTIIDLRYGKDKTDAQGQTEKDSAAALGVEYRHLPLLGSNARQKKQIEELIELYDAVPSPILVHCTSGTHRSGLASAVWLLTKEDSSPENATEQLSTRYGYFYAERKIKSLIQGHATIDAILWKYLEARKQSGISFRQWIKQVDEEKL